MTREGSSSVTLLEHFPSSGPTRPQPHREPSIHQVKKNKREELLASSAQGAYHMAHKTEALDQLSHSLRHPVGCPFHQLASLEFWVAITIVHGYNIYRHPPQSGKTVEYIPQLWVLPLQVMLMAKWRRALPDPPTERYDVSRSSTRMEMQPTPCQYPVYMYLSHEGPCCSPRTKRVR